MSRHWELRDSEDNIIRTGYGLNPNVKPGQRLRWRDEIVTPCSKMQVVSQNGKWVFQFRCSKGHVLMRSVNEYDTRTEAHNAATYFIGSLRLYRLEVEDE